MASIQAPNLDCVGFSTALPLYLKSRTVWQGLVRLGVLESCDLPCPLFMYGCHCGVDLQCYIFLEDDSALAAMLDKLIQTKEPENLAHVCVTDF